MCLVTLLAFLLASLLSEDSFVAHSLVQSNTICFYFLSIVGFGNISAPKNTPTLKSALDGQLIFRPAAYRLLLHLCTVSSFLFFASYPCIKRL